MKNKYRNKLNNMLLVGCIILVAILIFSIFNKWGYLIAGIFVFFYGMLIGGEKFEDDDWI